MSQDEPRQAVQAGPEAVARPPVEPTTKEPTRSTLPPWNWRLIVFLWFSSLLFLGLYEFLYTLMRALFR